MIKKTTEEVASREAKSTLKERGEHHNLICIRCRNVFPSGTTPLQHDAVREKVVRNQLADLTFISDGSWNKCGCEATMARKKNLTMVKDQCEKSSGQFLGLIVMSH
jgi:hypothetical protein